MPDNVNNPKHYQSENGLECIDVWVSLGIAKPACKANVIKYVWRYEQKNGIEDLKKAQWYLNKLIELETKDLEKETQLFDESLKLHLEWLNR